MNLNWYKVATLMDEIKRFGPESPFDPNDPEDQKRVEWISKKIGVSKDKVIEWLNDGFMGGVYKREFFAHEYGWSVPNQEAIEEIKKFVGQDSVIEIGSGHGMWARLMQDVGISISATDQVSSPQRGAYITQKNPFTNIEDLSAIKAIQKYNGANVLMMSWPPYDDPMAAVSIQQFRGKKLIFIGEDSGGCTGDDQFFKILRNEWDKVRSIDIPKWSGIHDYLSLWNRK